jgi:hypothetical protein
MNIDDPIKYGSIFMFNTKEDSAEYALDGNGVNAGLGLQVLYMQNLLLEFLLKCCKIVMEKEVAGLNLDAAIPDYKPPPCLQPGETRTDFFTSMAKESYMPSRGLNFNRLQYLVSAQTQIAKDHVWQLREDPLYFHHICSITAEHDELHIPGSTGRADVQRMKTDGFVLYVQRAVVARSHYTLILWDQLDRKLREVQLLMEENPEGIDMETLTPIDLVESV